MASSVFDTSKIYQARLFGHAFTSFPEGIEPELPGTFEADTVETSGQPGDINEFAVFTVSAPSGSEYPAAWAGTYRIPYAALVDNPPIEIGDVPTPPDPEPDPEPDPDDPDDPDTPSGDDPGDGGDGGDDPPAEGS